MTDFEVVNAIGKTVRTFGDMDRAVAWARHNVRDYGALEVHEVTVTVTRRMVYRPRVKKVVAAQDARTPQHAWRLT